MSIPLDFILLRRSLAAPVEPPTWPPGVGLAPLLPSDAPAIHEVLRRAYASGFGSVAGDWLEWWESVAADSEFDRNLCFVAKAGPAIAGFCLCWTSAFIKDLVVDPARQGHGIGSALLLQACAVLRSRGHDSVALKVMTGNTVARRLYAALGFVAA